MYAHQVIEDIDLFEKRLKQNKIGNPARDKMYCSSMFEARKHLKKAQYFHLGNYNDYLEIMGKEIWKTPLFMDSLAENVKLPYDICWFDFFIPKSVAIEKNKVRSSHRGILALYKEKYDLIFLYMFCRIDLLRFFQLGPLSHVISVGNHFDKKFPDYPKIEGNKTGNICSPPLLSTITHQQKQQVLYEDKNDIRTLNIALILLNCKNIITKKVIASKKLNKKRIKKKKVPIFDYYTLEVSPMSSGKQKDTSKSKNLWNNRLHLQRGHFKRFKKPKLLFGKYEGLYWWQPHVRGQNKNGVVVKDYEIKT